MEKKVQFNNRSGDQLVGILHTPRKSTSVAAVVCHGLRGNKDLDWIAELCRALSGQGYCALRFDFSGNGESEGRFIDSVFQKQVEDLKTAIDYLENQGYTQFVTVGHSMGGGVAILEAAKDIRVGYLIDIAAPSRPASNKAFVRGILTRLGITDQDRYLGMLQGVDILAACRKVHAKTLIVHGDKDPRVPLAQSYEIAKQIGGSLLHVIPNADHYFDTKSERNALIKTVCSWLTSKIGSSS